MSPHPLSQGHGAQSGEQPTGPGGPQQGKMGVLGLKARPGAPEALNPLSGAHLFSERFLDTSCVLPGGGDRKGIWRENRMWGGGHPERKGCGTLNERSQWKPRRLGVRVGSEAWVRQGSGLQPIGDEGPVVGFQQLRRSLPSQQCSGGPSCLSLGPPFLGLPNPLCPPALPRSPPSSRLWGHVRPAGVGSPPQRPEGRLAKPTRLAIMPRLD